MTAPDADYAQHLAESYRPVVNYTRAELFAMDDDQLDRLSGLGKLAAHQAVAIRMRRNYPNLNIGPLTVEKSADDFKQEAA
jgi:hypothetical protein